MVSSVQEEKQLQLENENGKSNCKDNSSNQLTRLLPRMYEYGQERESFQEKLKYCHKDQLG